MIMDGKTYKDISPASVQDDMIIIMRHDIPIRSGDKISHRPQAGDRGDIHRCKRQLASGTEEIRARYVLQVRRA